MDNSNSGGFGGREFKIIMVDESEKILKGPWTSNSKTMEMMGFNSSINTASKIIEDLYDVYYSVNLRPEIIQDNLNKIKPYNIQKPPKFFELIKTGKVNYDFKNNEPFIILENGESFYKPEL